MLWMKQPWVSRIAAFVSLMIVLAAGLMSYRDYDAATIDERIERTSSIINYQEITRVVFHRESFTYITDHPPLSEFKDRYYGVAMQLPMALAEDLYSHFRGRDMTLHQVYEMRHLYSFLVYTVALCCFYFCLKRMFKSPWLALCGCWMVFLFGRFFAHSFMNIKDMMFVSTMLLALMCAERVFATGRKARWCLAFAFAGALMTNTRLVGALMIACVMGAMFLQDVVNARRGVESSKPTLWRRVLPYLLVMCAYPFWILVSPASWQNPLKFSVEAATLFSNYSQWGGYVAFMGKLYLGYDLPWYFYIVWIGLTVPLVNQLLWFVGLGFGGRAALSRRKQAEALKPKRLMMGVALVMIALSLGYQMLAKPLVYNDWRHMFFLYPLLIIFSVYGLEQLWRLGQGRRLVRTALVCALAGSFAFNAYSMVKAHPFEAMLFNVAGKPVATDFERDYWGMIEFWKPENYLRQNPDAQLRDDNTILIYNKAPADISRYLDETVTDETEYIIVNFNFFVGSNDYAYEGFTEVDTLWVDNAKIASLLKRDRMPGLE